MSEENDYDYEGYIAKYGKPDQSKGQHLTDEFKLPNHITFSTGSKYHTTEKPGGEWVKDSEGKWNFYASPYNLQNVSAEVLQKYFKEKEPEAVLHLPSPYLSTQQQQMQIMQEQQNTFKPSGNPIVDRFRRKLEGFTIQWPAHQ